MSLAYIDGLSVQVSFRDVNNAASSTPGIFGMRVLNATDTNLVSFVGCCVVL
ncbi:MAG: hypothetical protein WCF23_09485 [Candidatus Nitrosopolaris sp.]